MSTEPRPLALPRGSRQRRVVGLFALLVAMLAAAGFMPGNASAAEQPATGASAAGAPSNSAPRLAAPNEEEQQQTYEHPINRIELDLSAGSVTLRPGQPDRVEIVRVVRWTSTKPTITEQWVGNTLQITTECAPQPTCTTDYEIRLPSTVVVDAQTGAGNLTMVEMAGELSLFTNAGDITGTGLTSGTINARSYAGNIGLQVVAVPDEVRATNFAGTVDLAVPPAGSGSDGYHVEASVVIGTLRVEVDSNPAGEHKLVARTTVGDVRVRYLS